ncbi:hypothetical protein C240_2235 [Enterococcus sp. 5H]|nr:hypothetical protein [Enterococcus sp. 5H]
MHTFPTAISGVFPSFFAHFFTFDTFIINILSLFFYFYTKDVNVKSCSIGTSKTDAISYAINKLGLYRFLSN